MLATTHADAAPAAPMVTGPVSELHMASLPGSMAAAVQSSVDRGAIAGGQQLQHVQLLLARPPAREAALDALVTAQTTPGSAQFHHWLTPAQLRADYGPAESDIAATASWLRGHGLSVDGVSPTGITLEFSGSAAAVAAAFHTTLHTYMRHGEMHMAPASAPMIPAALAPVVSGVIMSNFFPRPAIVPTHKPSRAQMAGATVSRVGKSYTSTIQGTTYYAVTPSDFATIYDETQAFNGAPFFSAPNAGAGQTVVVAEQTDILPKDVATFRSTFGLSGYKGSFSITHPGGCADPGRTPDEIEAALDAEWAGATAPDAKIVLAACSGAGSTFGFGVMVALQKLVETGTPAAAISVSYGGCEQGNGLTFLQAWSRLAQAAAAQGISVFVSSGDTASAGCDSGTSTAAVAGLAVNGLATTPYVTAIGGTDFLDTALGKNSVYWNATNSSTGGSAKSYIPEIPWDNACSNVINYTYAGAKGPIQNCNAKTPAAGYQNVVGGSGGQSLVFAKPSWQKPSILGVPNDGVRDIPDVSLFGANGFWNHFYLECMSDTTQGGVPCDYTNPNDFFGSAYGGTSFSAPAFAGIAALVAQGVGGRVGNMAPRLYQIAKLQFGNSVLAKSCDSGKGAAISRACVFYDTSKGDNSVACVAGSPDCFTNQNSTQGVGVLSVSPGKLTPAFPTTAGYDLATGLGTVNVTNLILNYYPY